MTDRQWILAKTKPRREAWAAENVVRQGREPYVPYYRDSRSGAKRPLWPSYIFVYSPDGQYTFLTGTYGISKVVIFGLRPALVADDLVQELKRSEVNGLVYVPEEPTAPRWRPGQPLKVVDGSLIGLTGIYQGMSSATRIRVMFELMGRAVETTMSEADVQPA